MRQQQRPQAPAQRHRDVAARADAVLAVVPHVSRVARASVSDRQMSADCAGTRVSAFSLAPQRAPCVEHTSFFLLRGDAPYMVCPPTQGGRGPGERES